MNKKVIRKGIFETNSSSTHSIILGNGDYLPNFCKLPIDLDGIVRIHSGEFGWEVEEYRDACTKASYALTWVKCAIQFCQDVDDGRMREGVAKDEYGLSKESEGEDKLAMLRTIIMNVTCCQDVVFVPEGDEYYPWGYIDHQSMENGGGPGAKVFESEEVLKRFIFDPNTVLRTDNDNL